jgi:hypothetical protein
MTDLTELGKRLRTCEHFRFMEGMLTQCGIRIVEGGNDYIIGHRSGPTSKGGGWVDTVALDGIYPDLSDAATKGCVLQLIREACSIMLAPYHYHPPTTTAAALWAVCRHTYDHMPRELWCLGAPTEEKLLTLMMEALPCPEP